MADDIIIASDGLIARGGGGTWTLDKLEIVRRYLPEFAKVTTGKVPFHFIDGFAGPGINVIEGKEYDGTPLIGLKTDPGFTSCLFMDYDADAIDALNQRTSPFGSRAVAQRGDTNVDLIPLMKQHLGAWNPALVLFDPEGTELQWETVSAVAAFKTRRTKLEQLILLATHIGFLRLLWVKKPIPEWAEEKVTRLYGTDEWKTIHADRMGGKITSDQATTRYVNLYRDQLLGLGYEHVLAREIKDRGFQGRLRYFLMFATQHKVGEKIMRHIYNTVSAKSGVQLPFFRRERTEE